MLHHVDVRNTKIGAGFLSLSLANPTNGFIVKEIEGLDPVKATLISSSFANLDGQTYHTSRRETRNIIIKLGLRMGAASIKALREQLYDVFMPKSEVAISFYDSDGTYVNINGVVETCEAPLFAKEPEMAISITCFDPDFVSPIVGTVSDTVVNTSVTKTLDYAGTVPTGLTFSMTATKYIPRLALCLNPPGIIERQLWFNTPMNAGDNLVITTTLGSRSALLKRSGSATALSALAGIPPESAWLELQPGNNNLRVWSDPAGVDVPYTLTWQIRHGGL